MQSNKHLLPMVVYLIVMSLDTRDVHRRYWSCAYIRYALNCPHQRSRSGCEDTRCMPWKQMLW